MTIGDPEYEVASHVDLVVLTRDLCHVAIEGDTDRVHSILCRIRTDLTEHLASEAPRLHGLEGATLAAITRGQQRLLALVDDMLLASDEHCACLRRSAELGHQIRRQARLEAALLPPAETRQRGAVGQPTGDAPSIEPTLIARTAARMRSTGDARSVPDLLVAAEQQQVASADGHAVAPAALGSSPADQQPLRRARAALRVFGAHEAAEEITDAVRATRSAHPSSAFEPPRREVPSHDTAA
jgi:hypothetical protein